MSPTLYFTPSRLFSSCGRKSGLLFHVSCLCCCFTFVCLYPYSFFPTPWGWLYAFLQFVMMFLLGWLYCRLYPHHYALGSETRADRFPVLYDGTRFDGVSEWDGDCRRDCNGGLRWFFYIPSAFSYRTWSCFFLIADKVMEDEYRWLARIAMIIKH